MSRLLRALPGVSRRCLVSIPSADCARDCGELKASLSAVEIADAPILKQNTIPQVHERCDYFANIARSSGARKETFARAGFVPVRK